MAKYNVSSSVGKAFRLLECLAANQPITAPEISKKLGFNKTNTYRLLATLVEIGYIYKGENGYNLTFKLLSLGRTAPVTRVLRSVAEPVMEKLMNIVHENVYLTTMVERKVFAIHSIKFPEHHLMLNPEKTSVFPLYSCSSGKIFLAYMSSDRRKKLLDKLKFLRLTPTTITDRQELEEELEKCKAQGYAIENKEFSEELVAVSAPIFGVEGEVLACLSFSGPSIRVSLEKIDAHIEDVVAAALEITKQIRKT